jgi:hypothetical protein
MFSPSFRSEGAGKAEPRLRPVAPVRKECTGQEPQVQPERPGLPRAMALRLLRSLPGAPGFLVTVTCATPQRHRKRGIGIGMPGPYDLTVRTGLARRPANANPKSDTSIAPRCYAS